MTAARPLGPEVRMTGAGPLERRYRRLLAVYPPAHRQVHGEEMVGVLLASARPRQRWPKIADAADLIAGAARIQFRAWQEQPAGQAWSDALALISVIAPILLLADGLATADLIGVAIRDTWITPEFPFWLGYWWIWPITFGPAIVTLFALAGWRRSVAVTALLTTAGAAAGDLTGSLTYLASPGLALTTYLGLLAAAGAILSPGPRRGMEILRWWGAAVIGAIAVFLAELTHGPEFNIWPMQGNNPVLLIGASLVLAVAACLISPTGRRLLILLAIPFVPYACYMLNNQYDGPISWPAAAWPPAVQSVWVLLPALLAIFVITALRRARAGPRGQAPPEDSRPTD